jgi:hypothetical protein
MCEQLPAITSLDISNCGTVTDEGLAAAVSSLPALTSLNINCCVKVTDAGVRAVSSLPALVSVNLSNCVKVTAAGVPALRNTTAAPSLHIESISLCRGRTAGAATPPAGTHTSKGWVSFRHQTSKYAATQTLTLCA